MKDVKINFLSLFWYTIQRKNQTQVSILQDNGRSNHYPNEPISSML